MDNETTSTGQQPEGTASTEQGGGGPAEQGPVQGSPEPATADQNVHGDGPTPVDAGSRTSAAPDSGDGSGNDTADGDGQGS